QAEDGIRDPLVTGVQTCALPICQHARVENRHQAPVAFGADEPAESLLELDDRLRHGEFVERVAAPSRDRFGAGFDDRPIRRRERSEERRVGKECGCGWWRTE